jgi:hypothetical protein
MVDGHMSGRKMRSFRPLPRRCYEPLAKVVAPALVEHWFIKLYMTLPLAPL